ncbi:outer membrane protein W [compost metagenome]
MDFLRYNGDFGMDFLKSRKMFLWIIDMNIFFKITIPAVFLLSTHLTHAESRDFKRWSVSAGWLHVMPQGKANTFDINTSVKEGTTAKVGSISKESFLDAIDPDATNKSGKNQKELASNLLNGPLGKVLMDTNGNIKDNYTGSATINGLEQWTSAAGLEAEDVDTLGLMVNYYINDNVSIQLIGGIPPKVDIKGKGEILAPFSGSAKPSGIAGAIGELDLLKDIPITNLSEHGNAATARAWTPALEAQYQFGKSGVNKFRPYIGAGLMYAYFSDIKLDSGVEKDLIAAGHMVQNILDNKAGAALDNKISSANPNVKVKATTAIAPVVSLGFTYDVSPSIYTVASVSYAKLNNKAKIYVNDANTGANLISATTKIDIDPIMTYLGVGFRF